jgi:hypothetical protein
MTPLDVRPVPINAIVPTGLYRRLREPGLFLAGETILGGLIGRRLSLRARRA